jgi:hypothetical protein
MGIFGKRSLGNPAPEDDSSWLLAGHRTFDRNKSRFFGSPETMRRGGEEALGKGDTATAVFFFAKAIDIAQTWLRNPLHQRTYEENVTLFRLYVDAIAAIKASHPDADVLTDWNNENGQRTANMMVAVAKSSFQDGHPIEELDAAINKFLTITGMPPQDHW